MNVLGLNRGDHDASAALVRDGRLLAFINVERLTRVKHDGMHLWEAVRYCLDKAGLEVDDVDLVVQNSYINDLEEMDRLARSAGQVANVQDFVGQFREVETISHHLAHAYCGVGLAPFDEAAILIADGIGQHLPGGKAEAESSYHLRNGVLETVSRRLGTVPCNGRGYPADVVSRRHEHSFRQRSGSRERRNLQAARVGWIDNSIDEQRIP